MKTKNLHSLQNSVDYVVDNLIVATKLNEKLSGENELSISSKSGLIRFEFDVDNSEDLIEDEIPF